MGLLFWYVVSAARGSADRSRLFEAGSLFPKNAYGEMVSDQHEMKVRQPIKLCCPRRAKDSLLSDGILKLRGLQKYDSRVLSGMVNRER